VRVYLCRTGVTLVLSVLIVSLLGGCGPSDSGPVTEDGQPLDVVRVAPWGPRLIDFIDLYVGEAQGFFEAEGIHVEQLVAEGAGDAIRNLIAGNADIAMADPFSGYFAVQRGADLSGFYCPYTENWMTMVVNSERGIASPADLAGKTIAVTSQASTSRYHVMFLLAANGLSEDEVRVAGVGRDFASVLLGGSVDAASTWRSLNWAMFRRQSAEEMGFEIWDYDQIPGPNDVYFARTEWLAAHKGLIARFVRAIHNAKLWIAENPDAAARIGSEYAIAADDLERNRAVIDLRIRMQSEGPGVATHGMGWCDVETMSTVAARATKLGILDSQIDVGTIITNEFTND